MSARAVQKGTSGLNVSQSVSYADNAPSLRVIILMWSSDVHYAKCVIIPDAVKRAEPKFKQYFIDTTLTDSK